MRLQLQPALGAAGAALLAPLGAHAVDYLSAEQAARVMFPDAERFEARTFAIDTATQQALAAQGLRPRGPTWSVKLARRADGGLLGIVVTDAVVGKVELIDYAVALDLQGRVRQVEVLSYRESHGHEIRLAAWRKQFVGKDAAAPLRVGEDIANISGATLSCSHVTDGIRRITLLAGPALRSGALA